MTVPTTDGIDAIIAAILIALLAFALAIAEWQRWDERRREQRMWRREML